MSRRKGGLSLILARTVAQKRRKYVKIRFSSHSSSTKMFDINYLRLFYLQNQQWRCQLLNLEIHSHLQLLKLLTNNLSIFSINWSLDWNALTSTFIINTIRFGWIFSISVWNRLPLEFAFNYLSATSFSLISPVTINLIISTSDPEIGR